MQRGALGALSPIQEGASRVLKPFRDLFGWFGDTIDAKDQRDEAIAERDAYRAQLVAAQNRMREAEQRAELNEMDTTQGMDQYGPGRRARLHPLAQQLVPARRRSTRAPTTASTAATR